MSFEILILIFLWEKLFGSLYCEEGFFHAAWSPLPPFMVWFLKLGTLKTSFLKLIRHLSPCLYCQVFLIWSGNCKTYVKNKTNIKKISMISIYSLRQVCTFLYTIINGNVIASFTQKKEKFEILWSNKNSFCRRMQPWTLALPP